MSKHLTLAVLALAMVALAVGCGDTTKVFIRKDAEPINVETEKLLILNQSDSVHINQVTEV